MALSLRSRNSSGSLHLSLTSPPGRPGRRSRMSTAALKVPVLLVATVQMIVWSITSGNVQLAVARTSHSRLAAEFPGKKVNVPAMFTFGDSWSDSGNNNFLEGSLARADFSPNGIDFLAAKPTGRFTNGRTLNDYIGYFLGLDPQPPYLSISTTNTSETDWDKLKRGVNFASGGAGILDESGAVFKHRISLSSQLSHFQEVRHRLRNLSGTKEMHRLVSTSLYFVSIGSSDYLHNYLLPDSKFAEQYSAQEFQDMLISSLSQHLKKLHSMGARKIAVAGLPPLGSLPGLRHQAMLAPTTNVNFSSSLQLTMDLDGLSRMAKDFNDAIQHMLADLSNHLVGSFFTFTDTFDRVRQIVENPLGFGFEVANVSCCGLGDMGCSFGTPICINRASHVFWDKHHTTDRANLLLASYLTFGSESAPFNLLDLARKK